MFFKSIFAAAVLAGAAVAAPVPSNDNAARATFDIKSAAMAYVGKQWNVTPLYDLWWDSGVQGPSGGYAFLRQQVNSEPLANSFATVMFDANGNVVQFKSSKSNVEYVADNFPGITVNAAATAVTTALPGFVFQGVPASFGGLDSDYRYIARSTGSAEWTYPLPFVDASGVPYTVYVNSADATIEQITNEAAGTTIVTH